MQRLYVSDMDGTLLGSDSRVSVRSAEVLSRVGREGALFTVATARTPATVQPLLAGVYSKLPAIVMTGAALWDRTAQRFIDPVTMGAQLEKETVDRFLAHGVNPFVYRLADASRLEVFHNGTLTRREENFWLDRRDLPLKRFVFDRPEAYSTAMDDVMLMLGIGGSERIMPLADELRGTGQLSVSAYRDPVQPTVAYIEVFAAGVSKRAAVERLAAMTGAEAVTVYGDNLNDLSMMEAATDAVAVENAMPEVKRAASRIIGPNTADAVALDVEQLFEHETR